VTLPKTSLFVVGTSGPLGINSQVSRILNISPKDPHVFLAKTASNQPLLKTR
jgi:hypothetical protein